MKRCPITYEIIDDNQVYSKQGLHLLSPKLTQLASLTLTAADLRQEALNRAGKMSIQGVQEKLSAKLKIKQGCFDIVDQGGQYILKPPNQYYPELPANEAITMSMAKVIGLEVPVHGLVYAIDNSLTYFIKRFDRIKHKDKLPVEDFSQLLGYSRDSKYNSSMEKVITVIEKYCTFPQVEYLKFFKLTLFNYLMGNEDMHLKNFSLTTRKNIITLAPAYDLLNTTIAQTNTKEELALPLNGKKNNLTKKDFFEYLAKQRLNLNAQVITDVINDFNNAIPIWQAMIKNSFLSVDMQEKYLTLLNNRISILN